MKVVTVCILSAILLLFSGCDRDVDLILNSDLSGSEEAGLSEVEPPEGIGTEPLSDEEQGDMFPSEIFVYICGAVKFPGVYELKSGSRVYELVDLAGGLTEDADECCVNFAGIVEDGEMIRILTREESDAGITYGEGSLLPGEAGADSGKVNINTAGVEELMTLAGIGEVKAAAIVSYRDEHGSFKSTEEIMEVSGIGEGTYARIKEQITF